MKPISEEVNLIIRKIFNLHNPSLGEIIINWNKIIGHKYAECTIPLSIKQIREKGQKKNILNVRVTNSSLFLELHYIQDIMIERMTIHLGFKVIDKIRFINYSASRN